VNRPDEYRDAAVTWSWDYRYLERIFTAAEISALQAKVAALEAQLTALQVKDGRA
jgi:hypothetical protein